MLEGLDETHFSSKSFKSLSKPQLAPSRKKTYTMSFSQSSDLKLSGIGLKFATVNMFSAHLVKIDLSKN
jgi:hypothetical protein